MGVVRRACAYINCFPLNDRNEHILLELLAALCSSRASKYPPCWWRYCWPACHEYNACGCAVGRPMKVLHLCEGGLSGATSFHNVGGGMNAQVGLIAWGWWKTITRSNVFDWTSAQGEKSSNIATTRNHPLSGVSLRAVAGGLRS